MKKQGIKKWIKRLLPSRGESPVKGIECPEYRQKEEDGWTEAEAEIINHLISMDSIMRITKQLDYFYEYITLEQINQVLCEEVIDLSQTKKALLGGLFVFDAMNERKYTTKSLPYQYYSLRSLLWKINLGYLGSHLKRKWISHMEKNLLRYSKMLEDFIITPVEKKLGILTRKKSAEPSDAPKKDHPLNFSQESKWQNYFRDRELWQQIEKDTRRTRRNCTFFTECFQVDMSHFDTQLSPRQLSFLDENAEATYADCLTRIIFIYLKTHPEESYSQGMNEYAALVLYCFTNKNSEYFRRVSESDSYFVFEQIMEMLPRKHFQKGPDYVKKLNAMLLKIDLRLYEEVQKQGGLQNLELLTMRWFLTGFLSEFQIDECLQLWDVLVGWPEAETGLADKFMYMGLAMLHLHRERIMEGENVTMVLSKVSASPMELGEKTLNLFRIFPKLVAE